MASQQYSSAIGEFVIGLSPIQGEFLPLSPVTVQSTISSYLYWQYADDDNLQSMVDAYNGCQQYYLDWFNETPLAIYTSTAISGSLLDWVGFGLYGVVRPMLGSSYSKTLGAVDTITPNELAVNASKTITSGSFQTASDDIYKRVITWNFYKGDGKHFTIKWLKKRVARFLTGLNGTDPGIQETYDISVTSGSHGSAFGSFSFGVSSFGAEPNTVVIAIKNPANYDPNVLSALQQLVNQRTLNLPFQYQFAVSY